MQARHSNIIIGALTLFVVGLGGFLVVLDILESSGEREAGMLVSSAPVATTSSLSVALGIMQTTPPPDGYIEYRNETYGFSFYHSPQAQTREYDEGNGAMTVVLENEQKVRGFQIFIIPYAEDTISEERFAADVPSGVRTNVEPTTVGEKHIEAVTFNSYDQFLGDTREIWFIYNGYLFEITTFKGVADWLIPKMQTWRFF